MQTESLRKLALFCKNPNLIDEKQVQLRSKCLEYWHIPNLPRAPAKKFTTDDLLNIAIQKPGKTSVSCLFSFEISSKIDF